MAQRTLSEEISQNLLESEESVQEIVERSEMWEENSQALAKDTQQYKQNLQESIGFVQQITDQIPLMTEGMTEALEEPLMDIAEPVFGQFEAMKQRGISTFKSIGTAGQIAIVGVVAAIAGAIALFKQWDDVTSQLIDDIGAGRKQIEQISAESQTVWMNMAQTGISLDTVQNVAGSLVQEFGVINSFTENLIETTSKYAQGLGIGADNAAKLVRLQKSSLGLTNQQLEQNAKRIKAISQQLDIGPGQVANQLAENSEAVAKYSNENATNMIQAAAYAEKLGTNLDDVVNIANNMLDLEEATQSAMQAQFMLGTDINVARARRQALTGNMTGMMDTLVGQLSETKNLNELNMMQRQSIADLLGVSVDKAMQMVRQYESTKELADELNMTQEELNNAEYGLSGMQSKLESISNHIQYAILPLLTPVFKVFEGIFWTIDQILIGLGKFNELTRDWLGNLGGGIASLTTISGLIYGLTKIPALGGTTGGIFGKIGGMFGKGTGFIGKLGSKIGGFFKSIGNGINNFINKINPAKLLAAAGAFGIVSGSIWVLSQAMQEFSQGVEWSGVAMGITTMLAITGAVAALGAIMMSGVGTVAILAGATAMSIMAGSMWLMSEAMQGFAQASQTIIPFFEVLSTLEPMKLMSVAGAITAIGSSMLMFGTGSMVAGVGALVSGGFFTNLLQLSNRSTQLQAISSSLNTIAGLSGNLHFSKMANQIELLVTPLAKVADKANEAKQEMLGLAGTTTTATIANTVSSLISSIGGSDESEGGDNKQIAASDVYIDRKKVGQIAFDYMRGD